MTATLPPQNQNIPLNISQIVNNLIQQGLTTVQGFINSVKVGELAIKISSNVDGCSTSSTNQDGGCSNNGASLSPANPRL